MMKTYHLLPIPLRGKTLYFFSFKKTFSHTLHFVMIVLVQLKKQQNQGGNEAESNQN